MSAYYEFIKIFIQWSFLQIIQVAQPIYTQLLVVLSFGSLIGVACDTHSNCSLTCLQRSVLKTEQMYNAYIGGRRS